MYGVSIVVTRFNNEDKVPFGLMCGFEDMHWNLCKGDKKKIKRLNKSVIEEIDKKDLIDFDRLMIAPCDSVVVITGEETYEKLNHNPIDCSKGSLNEGLNLLEYLYGRIEAKFAGTETA